MKIKISYNRCTWGFSVGAESWNGRLAMLAFMVIVCLEFFFLSL
nr:CAB/ELIP/HLIP superfamily protein [Polyopes affinis]WOL37006.1 CAB/ELIP/HLIP superfamily protein [Polyopes affinis]